MVTLLNALAANWPIVLAIFGGILWIERRLTRVETRLESVEKELSALQPSL
jgi:uncharacterized iron-regulated membrane protein